MRSAWYQVIPAKKSCGYAIYIFSGSSLHLLLPVRSLLGLWDWLFKGLKFSLTFGPVQLKSSFLLPKRHPVIVHGSHSVVSGVWLCNPTDCSPPGSSVHGILQTRILEWGAMPFSRESSWPRDQTRVSCIIGGFFTIWAPGKPKLTVSTWRCSCGILHFPLVLTPLQPNGYLCDSWFTCSLLSSRGTDIPVLFIVVVCPPGEPPCHGVYWSESCSVMSDSLRPMDLYSPWNSPGQNTGVGSLSLFQGTFPTQGLNPGFPHCRRILYCPSQQSKPKNTGVGSPPLLQGIFLSRDSNQGLLHCRWILYELRYQGSPMN